MKQNWTKEKITSTTVIHFKNIFLAAENINADVINHWERNPQGLIYTLHSTVGIE